MECKRKECRKKNTNTKITSSKVKKKSVLTSTQPVFTCSKLTVETLEEGVKYVQSYQ